MANKIILRPQIFNFKEILCQLPQEDNLHQKIFFQAELQSLENGDAAFGIIAYPAWYKDGCWQLGKKVTGIPTGEACAEPFTGPLGFANNELVVSFSKKSKNRVKKQGREKELKNNKEFMELFRKISRNADHSEKATFQCSTSISDNPHLQYDVTLEGGGTSSRAKCNPIPPSLP